MMTNEEIDRMAAEALGIEWCPGRWEIPNGIELCQHFARETDEFKRMHADFCDDLNAAQRLVKKVGGEGWAMTDKRYAFEVAIQDLSEGRFYFYFLLPAKNITLACLVALGKITLEEAKESL